MRYRGNRVDSIPELDALTRADLAKVRTAALASVPVGLEGLASLASRCFGEPVKRGAPSPHVLGVGCKGHPVIEVQETPTKPRKGKRA